MRGGFIGPALPLRGAIGVLVPLDFPACPGLIELLPLTAIYIEK